jgi:hypothetical protein
MNINVGLQLSAACGLFEAMTAAVPRRMPPTIGLTVTIDLSPPPETTAGDRGARY